MSIHAETERSELPSIICECCDNQEVGYISLDRDNEIAAVCIHYCEAIDDCPLLKINWEEFLRRISNGN